MNILRCDEVVHKTGLSRTTIWRMERAGTFPSRLRLSANAVGWSKDEITDWLEDRPRGMTGSPRRADGSSGSRAA
jgi:predicted DNA-binding transcriptional regulator AlpA